MKEPKTDFGSWIRTERKKLGLSQKELADKCGVSQMTIRRYESGMRKENNSITKIKSFLKGDSIMEEKRGYPNPNYTEEDVMTEEEAILEEVGLVTVPVDHYEMLVSKAAALDIIAADIKANIDMKKSFNRVNDSLVMAVTGMNTYAVKKGEDPDE